MSKIKHWYKKLNKFEKVIFWFFLAVLIFFLLIALINIPIALGYAGIKLKTVTWQTFSTAYSKDICFKISAIIDTIVVIVFAGFIGYQKWQHFDMFAYEQKKKEKRKEQEFKQIPQDNLLKLNKNFGLIKSNLTQHTLLVGTTGSGKTTTVMFFVKQLTKIFKQTTIIIDGKGDIDLIDKVKQLDQNSFVWQIGGETEYNPFATNDTVVLADKIMSLFDFSELYYRDKAQHFLLILLDIMVNNKINVTLKNIIEYFNIEKLLNLVDVKSPNYDMLCHNFTAKEITGMLSKLDITNIQLNKNITQKNSLLELISKHKTILFSINSLKYPKLASAVGKIIIQDLKELTTLKPVNQKINIVLDEFNVFASETIVNLINKSRSFNYQCFLSFQTINDLKIESINLTDTIFGNVSNIICHNIKDPNTSEYLSSVFGTQETEKLTRQLDFKNNTADMGSVRSVDEFIVHPNELKNLKIGGCYFKTTMPSGNLCIKKIKVDPACLDLLIQHLNKKKYILPKNDTIKLTK